MMANDLMVQYESEFGPVKLDVPSIKKYLVSGDPEAVTEQEFGLFIMLCKGQKLNPFLKDAYLIKYGAGNPATLAVSKDVHERRAAAMKEYNGMKSGIILKNEKGLEYRDGHFMLEDEKLVGGWAEAYRGDWEFPVKITVALHEYIGKKKDGTINKQWKSKPATMIEKVARSQAHRGINPTGNKGLYTEEENVPLAEIAGEITTVEPQKQDKEELTPGQRYQRILAQAQADGINDMETIETVVRKKLNVDKLPADEKGAAVYCDELEAEIKKVAGK